MELILNSYYANNASKLHKMVDKILIKLKFHDVDNEDFYSLANEIFVDVLKRYNESQDFDGFLYSCLYKKFCTEMTRRGRQKRQADKSSISIYTHIGDEESDSTLCDMITDNKTVEDEIFEESRDDWGKEMKEYLSSLSPLQKKIVFLLSDNNTPDEICKELHITMKHFDNSMKRILADEKIRPLRKLVERN